MFIPLRHGNYGVDRKFTGHSLVWALNDRQKWGTSLYLTPPLEIGGFMPGALVSTTTYNWSQVSLNMAKK